jgi:hypothetical protein
VIEFLLTPFVFLLGVVLCIQALAACYAIIDLWYAIDEHQIRLAVRVLAWGVLFLAPWWWLPAALADVYARGGWLVIIVHVSIALLGQLMPRVAMWADRLQYWSLSRRETRTRARALKRKA